jgi:hypothetical protein
MTVSFSPHSTTQRPIKKRTLRLPQGRFFTFENDGFERVGHFLAKKLFSLLL